VSGPKDFDICTYYILLALFLIRSTERAIISVPCVGPGLDRESMLNLAFSHSDASRPLAAHDHGGQSA
jgi:hypothetical protein